MPCRNPTAALTDILDNIVLARSFVAGMDFTKFKQDRKTVYAVTRCLEIISEAVRKLPAEIEQRYPHLPWRNMRAAGNLYRHQYDDVSEAILWKTLETGLADLEKDDPSRDRARVD
jgi:uncharacterized protein with HEPN domain